MAVKCRIARQSSKNFPGLSQKTFNANVCTDVRTVASAFHKIPLRMAHTCFESIFHCEEWLFISVCALTEEFFSLKVDPFAYLHDRDISGRLLNVV